MKYFSMFSGIGGFELGIDYAFSIRDRQTENTRTSTPEQSLESAAEGSFTDRTSPDPELTGNTRKVSCVGYSEIDKYAIKVYERNFNGHRNYGDATKINPTELPDFDILVGGFPCQAFSIAGKRAGFDDTRGTLFFDIARILKEKRPRHLVLENVKGLLSHDSGRTFTAIIGILTDLGYSVEWQVLNSKDFGVPQNRERIYIVGHLGNECGRKVFPIEKCNRKSTKPLGLQGARQIATTLRATDYKGTHNNIAERQTLQEEWDSPNTEHGPGWTKSSFRIRRLTPKECERLQGFPDDWTAGESDTQRYKMCGNAVTVSVVEAVMRGLSTCQ